MSTGIFMYFYDEEFRNAIYKLRDKNAVNKVLIKLIFYN